MPTGKAECFGQQSREEGIKQKVNTCITPARTKAQSCIDWLIEQHRIGRPHIIELSKQIASGFEKSISQRTSLQRPLQQPEIFARDNEFLLNIQWLLENWAELISTINQGFLAIDGRALTDTIQLFEVEFQRMATAIQIYITKSKEPQIIKMQQAAMKLQSTLALNPVYPTQDLRELSEMLQTAANPISLAQFQESISPLRNKIANIQKSLAGSTSNPKTSNVEQFYVALAESLKQCQEILLSIKDDLTDQMLLVMNKLQQVTKQVKLSEKPQEQFERKQNILALAKERFTRLTRDFSKDPAMRLVDITIAQAMLPKEEELSQQKPMTTESLIIIELIHLLDTENKKIEKLVAKDDRKTRHFRKMSQVMQQKAAGQPTDKADEELLRLLQDEKIRLENALKKGKEEFAQTMEEINKIKTPLKRLITLNQKLQELSKSQKADVTAAAAAAPSVTPPVRLLPAAASATQPQPLQEALQLKKSDGLDELDMLLESLTAGDPPASARASIPHVLPTQQKTPRIPRTTEQFESLEPSPHPLMFTTAPQLPPEPNPASHHSRSSSSFTSDSQFAKFVATTTAAIKNPSFTL